MDRKTDMLMMLLVENYIVQRYCCSGDFVRIQSANEKALMQAICTYNVGPKKNLRRTCHPYIENSTDSLISAKFWCVGMHIHLQWCMIVQLTKILLVLFN